MRGPVLRVSLFTRSAQEHILVLVVHHIVVDFWSLAVILNEIGVLYPAEKAGRPAALLPLDLQYTDFIRWQTEMLASPEGERLWAYWKKQLAGPLSVLNLPTDRPRPAVQTFRGATVPVVLPAELTARLRALGRAEGATPFMTLLAAWQLLLGRCSGQQDVAVWTSATGASWKPSQSSGLNGSEAWQIDALAPSGSAVTGIGAIVTQQSQQTVTFTLPSR